MSIENHCRQTAASCLFMLLASAMPKYVHNA